MRSGLNAKNSGTNFIALHPNAQLATARWLPAMAAMVLFGDAVTIQIVIALGECLQRRGKFIIDGAARNLCECMI